MDFYTVVLVSSIILALITSVISESPSNFNISSDVPESGITLDEGSSSVFQFNITTDNVEPSYVYSFTLVSADEVIATTSEAVSLPGDECIKLNEEDTTCYWTSNYTVNGHRLGRTTLKPHIAVPATFSQNLSDDPKYDYGTPQDDAIYPVAVFRVLGPKDIIFKVIVALSVVINFIGFGCKFDRDEAKDLLHRPFPIILGSGLLFTLMPLLSFALTSAAGLSGIYKLGLLATGCSPSGGFSNVATLLMNGDVTLSLCLTISNGILAIGMMPLWLLTLGQSFLDDDDVTIPFLDVLQSLLLVIIPLAVGMLIRRFLPKIANKFVRVLKPVTLLLTLAALAFGFWANIYALYLSVVSWHIPIPVFLMTYLGLIIAAFIAYFCRQSKERIIAIACEVSLQNFGVAYVVLMQSLPQPDADLAAVMPLNSGLYQPCLLIPIAFYKCFLTLYRGAKHDFLRRKSDSDKDPAIESVADLHIGVIECVIAEDTEKKATLRSQYGEDNIYDVASPSADYGTMYNPKENSRRQPETEGNAHDYTSSGPVHISRDIHGITNVAYRKDDDIDDVNSTPPKAKF